MKAALPSKLLRVASWNSLAKLVRAMTEPKLTLRLSFFLQRIHPAVLLLLWCFALLVASGHGLFATSVCAILACALSAIFSWPQFLRMLRRTRWLLLATAVSFAVSTPGEIIPWLPLLTYDGLRLASEQLANLLLMLGMVSVLLALLDTSRLMQAIFTVLRPYAWLGGDRERVVVRLALTIDQLRGDHASPAPSVPSVFLTPTAPCDMDSSMRFSFRAMRPAERLMVVIVVLAIMQHTLFSAVL